MTREEIKQIIIKKMHASFPEFDGMDIQESDKVNPDIGLDSMTMTYLICSIEEELDINIPPRKWKKIVTLKDFLDCCESELAKNK